MIFEHANYREFLKAALVERQKKNPQFSLRAFAKQLGLSPAGLTRILQGQKNLSLDRASEIARKLALGEKETEYLYTLIQMGSTKNADVKAAFQDRLNQIRGTTPTYDLSVDHFKLISDWYHLAIYEMVDVDGVDFTPAGIASFLGISKPEAELAIARLLRLELITIENGRPRRLTNDLLVSSQIPNEAMRKHYRQILDKALKAVDEQSPSEKVIGTQTFAFDPEQLPEASKLTAQYLQAMCELAARSSKRTEMYQLFTEFFKLNTSPEEGKKV